MTLTIKDKIGFVVNSLGPSQLNFELIKQINQHVDKNVDRDFIIFYDRVGSPGMFPGFAVMDTTNIYNYDGVLVATDIGTAMKITHAHSSPLLYFYIQDLEWLRMPHKQYTDLSKVYRHPHLNLMARSDTHCKIIANAWNVDVKLMGEFDMTKFLTIMDNHECAFGANKRFSDRTIYSAGKDHPADSGGVWDVPEPHSATI